jgi:two-component system NtrC family response regulator
MQPSNTARGVEILSVSPLEEDHQFLRSVVSHSAWALFQAGTLADALNLLRQRDFSVVLCERELMPGTWTDLLEAIRHLAHPPSLIVVSKLADDCLWAEALNLGAWDVLQKPFERTEVLRSAKTAWQHWYDQVQRSASPARGIGRAS